MTRRRTTDAADVPSGLYLVRSDTRLQRPVRPVSEADGVGRVVAAHPGGPAKLICPPPPDSVCCRCDQALDPAAPAVRARGLYAAGYAHLNCLPPAPASTVRPTRP